MLLYFYALLIPYFELTVVRWLLIERVFYRLEINSITDFIDHGSFTDTASCHCGVVSGLCDWN